jgi:hypothetical protein
MNIVGKLFGGSNNIERFVKKLQCMVSDNSTGHLPLKYRVELMRRIGKPDIINKILFECAKKVYPIWQNDYPEESVFADILYKLNEYLYQNKHIKEDFLSLADANKNYAESGEESSNDAAIAIVFLCYSIAGNAGDLLRYEPDYEYNNEDDNEYDADCLTVDFYASLAYSEGSPFTADGNVSKRKEFWMWFLNTALKLIKTPGRPVLALPLKKEIKITTPPHNLRTQSCETTAILDKIDLIVSIAWDIAEKESVKWTGLIVKSNNLAMGNNARIFYTDENNEEKSLKGNLDIIQYVADIKKEMYSQRPEEGAWLQSCLNIYPYPDGDQYTFRYVFNYDDYEKLEDYQQDNEELKFEFEKYPRSKEFTPDWWQRILGKRAKYLN